MHGKVKKKATVNLQLTDPARTFNGVDASVLSENDVIHLINQYNRQQNELKQQSENLQAKQAELAQLTRRYTDIYDFSPIAYLTLHNDGTICELNLTAARMLGTDRKQLIGRKFTDFIVDRDIFNRQKTSIENTGDKATCSLHLKRYEGHAFHAVIEINPVCGNHPDQYRLMISDLSAIKEMEISCLGKIKDKYRGIVMDQKDLICRFDPQGKITFVNDAYCQCFGVRHTDIIGTNFLPRIHEDDLSIVGSHFQNLTLDNPGKTIEHRVFTRDDRLCWQQWHGRALFDNSGKIIEYQAVGRDITQLKNTQEELQKELHMRQVFLDALPCLALLIHYPSRKIIAANKTASIHGAEPGLICYQSWLKRDSHCPDCPAKDVVRDRTTASQQCWNNGIHWNLHWTPVSDELYLHYAFDTTEAQINKETLIKEHDRLEEHFRTRTLELQESNAKLLHSEKLASVGNISVSIAHEFTNPLQSIMTTLQSIEQYASLQDMEKQLVFLALKECNRMKNLLTDLRELYRPSTGVKVEFDLHPIIDALLMLVEKDYYNRNIRINKRYADILPPIEGIPDQLKQVIMNLISNSADACNNGGEITLTTELAENEIAIHVEDTGSGISKKHLARVFEPFFTTKSETMGTGLGLSLSHSIIKNHGGRITVQSEANKNTSFSIFLPIRNIGKNEQEKDTSCR